MSKLSVVAIVVKDQSRGRPQILFRNDYAQLAAQYFGRIWKREDERREKIEFDVDFSIRTKARTLRQNNLLWALITIIVNEHNQGRDVGGDLVDKDDIYQALLEEYAPIRTTDIGGKHIRHHVGTSKLSTRQMAEFIDCVFGEIQSMDIQVTDPSEIKRYWEDWRSYLRKQNIELQRRDADRNQGQLFDTVEIADGQTIPRTGGEHETIRNTAIETGAGDGPELRRE